MELLSKSSRTKNKSTDEREIYLDLSKWFPLIGTQSIFIAEWNTLRTIYLKKKLQILPVFRSLKPTTILKKNHCLTASFKYLEDPIKHL